MDIKVPELNYVCLSGRLTRDPEQRFTGKGQGVTSFDVAVNRRYKDAVSGEWKDNVVFVPISVWGPMADRCKERLRKGSPVLVEGNLVSSEYTDKSGQKRKIIRVNARHVQFLFYGEGFVKVDIDCGCFATGHTVLLDLDTWETIPFDAEIEE